MPTVTYTNRPELQGQKGTIYAPDLPWWVSKEQPDQYDESLAGDLSYYQGGQFSSAQDTGPGVVSPGVAPGVSIPVGRVASGGTNLDISSILSGISIPEYSAGAGKQAVDQGFKFPTAGGRPKTPTGSVTTATSRRVFEGERPELELPKRDERRVERLRQQAAGPGLRKLRTALSRALVRSYENPNVARMVTRSALAGYGEGLESVLAGAGRTAEAQYGQELQLSSQEALANYQAALGQFMASGRTVTEQKTQQTFGSGLKGDDRFRGRSRPEIGIA